jgi:hypothetical protein
LIRSTQSCGGILTIGMAAALLLLQGCAGVPQTRSLQQAPPQGISPAVELVEVPFHPQERWQCGPAALATVLQWQHVDVTPEALVSQVYVPARRGSLQPEMLAAVRRHERIPYVLAPDMSALIAEIAAGHPVLVLQNLALSWAPRWHYAVVIGFDLTRQELVLRSGTIERQRISMAVFERTWRRGGHWAVVVTFPDQLPATAQELNWLRAVLAFEQAGQWALAATAYQAAAGRWADSAGAWMGFGNNRFHAGDLEGAVEAFRHLLVVRPDYPPALNNLAYTLLQLDRIEEARRLAARAVHLEPDNQHYVRTLEEIGAKGSDAFDHR